MYEKKLVPVFIDKSVSHESGQTVRFYYFVLTFTETIRQALDIEFKRIPDSPVDFLKPLSLPVIWLESYHRFILSGPLGGGDFSSTEKIDQSFEFFEEREIDVDAVFHTFQNKPGESHLDPKRGEVYRLDSQVIMRFENTNEELPFVNNNNMIISDEETDVFRLWNRSVVDQVKTRYRDTPDRTLRLRVKGEDQ